MGLVGSRHSTSATYCWPCQYSMPSPCYYTHLATAARNKRATSAHGCCSARAWSADLTRIFAERLPRRLLWLVGCSNRLRRRPAGCPLAVPLD
jgi:hypothetical protein